MKNNTKEPGYKGFLHIKCPCCGKPFSFNARVLRKEYECNDCHTKLELENLVPLYLNCKCGRSFRYFTNAEETIFGVSCLSCGAPVAVEYISKKARYETIR